MEQRKFVGIIDGHEDVPYALLSQDRDFYERSEIGQVDLPRLREGGVSAALFAIYIEDEWLQNPLARTVQVYDKFRSIIEEGQGKLAQVDTVDELLAANAAGQFAVVLHAEGADALDADLGLFRVLYDLGLRSLGLTWSRTNLFAEGVGPKNEHHGLTEAGFRLVEEANRLGVLLDVSHINEEGFWDVIRTSKAPVVATHSCAKCISPAMRNLTDDQIRAIAKSGGTIGINFYAGFLRPDAADNYGEAAYPNTDPGLIVDHIDHIVKLVGIDHVAFGSDYDGDIEAPAGMEDVSKFPIIIDLLKKRGYSEEDVYKISSQNLLRVFSEVWKP